MILNCIYLTDSPRNSFVPRKIFKRHLDDKIWMEMNLGLFPPIEFISVDGLGLLGIDGSYIKIKVNPNNVDVRKGDVASLRGYKFYIEEIL